MMAFSTPGYAAPFPSFPQYAKSDAGLDDWSRQLPASQLMRRLSRGSNGQRTGNSMRVTKPSSTSNSPRSATQPGRRRTLVNDERRKQQIIDQVFLPMPGTDMTSDPMKRAPRPVSWHPASSHYQVQPHILPQPRPQPQQQQQPTTYYVPTAPARLPDQDIYTNYQHMSPMQSSYSCQTSPVTFSPLSLPCNDFTIQPCLPVDSRGWALPPQLPSYVSPPVETCNISPAVESNLDHTESYPPLFTNTNNTNTSVAFTAPTSAYTADNSGHLTQTSSIADWKSFAQQGFDGTSPPTPENLPQVQQVKTAVKSEDSARYEPLLEPEDESEVLVGMGLYDTPDKYTADPGLNNYRSTLPSLLESGVHRHQESGRGLMLEETWQPPESDDEDEEDEGGAEEGEKDDES